MPEGDPMETTGESTMERATPRPQLPGWTVGRVLGQGAHATVWLVADARGEQAALKVPVRDPAVPVGALQDEMRAVGELRHEHVVRPLGVVETDSGPGLLSEYHPGGSLGALVRAAGPLPLARVVTVLVPIAQALEALHAAGVVHGDVSPGNILFTVQGRPALADLGSSRVLGGAEHRLGTPGFTAPELDEGGVEGEGTGLHPAADLYSLAAVGWYALTGRAPSRTSARAPLPLILPEVPREVVHLLEAGLDEDPGNRPDAAQFAVACYRWATPEPLDLFAAASPELARELPTRRRGAAAADRRWQARQRWLRWTRRSGPTGSAGHRWWRAAGGAAAVAALAWGGITLLGPPDRDEGTAVTSPPAAPSAPSTTASPPPSSAPTTASTLPAPSGPPAPSTSGHGEDSDLRTAVEALGPARARALTSLDPTDLTAYSVPDSPAHRADADLLGRLAEQGLRFRDLDLHTRVDGEVDRDGADRATVRMELRIGPYSTVAAEGEVVETTEGETVEHLTVLLQRTDRGWRVLRIDP